jgi:hypothetical protein
MMASTLPPPTVASLPDEALASAQERVRQQPELAICHYELGRAHSAKRQFEDAERAFREAVRLSPADNAARLALGEALQELRQLEAAAWHYREALRLDPTCPDAHRGLGLALQDLGQLDDAIACFREALRLDPAHRARFNLGAALQAQGHIDEGREQFLLVLEHDPHNVRAINWAGRDATGRLTRWSNDQIAHLERRATLESLDLRERIYLHHALGWVYDAARNYSQAFRHFRLAKEARAEQNRQAGIAYDQEAWSRMVDRTISLFTPAFFERTQSFGSDSELPLFITGVMRSGSTLADQILASHPQVHGVGELDDLNQLTGFLVRSAGPQATYPECLAQLDAVAAKTLAEGHIRRLRWLGRDATRVVNKLVHNFVHLGTIAILFPRARIVHCRRDPVDTCLSCFCQDFVNPYPFTCDLSHLGHFYSQYERLMAHWKRVLPLSMFELQYEQLTADQEAVSRQLVEYCGLEWSERCLRFNETPRTVWTASMLQVRRPIYRGAVGRWRRYQEHLEPLLTALGMGRKL